MTTTFRCIRERVLPWQGLTVVERMIMYGGCVASFLLAIVFMCAPHYQWSLLTCFCAGYTELIVLSMIIKRMTWGMAPLVDRANAFDIKTAALVWLIWFCIYGEFHSF